MTKNFVKIAFKDESEAKNWDITLVGDDVATMTMNGHFVDLEAVEMHAERHIRVEKDNVLAAEWQGYGQNYDAHTRTDSSQTTI